MGRVVALNDHPLPPPPSSPPRSTNHLSGKRIHQGSSCGCGSATWSRCLLCLAETTPAPACGERQHLPPQQKGKEGCTSVHPLHLPHPIFFPLFYILVRQWMKIFCPSCLMWIAPVFCFFHVGTLDGCTKCGGGFGGGGGCEVADNATTHAKERRYLAFQCLLMYTHVCPKRTFNPDWHVRLLSHAARKKQKKRDKPPPPGGTAMDGESCQHLLFWVLPSYEDEILFSFSSCPSVESRFLAACMRRRSVRM